MNLIVNQTQVGFIRTEGFKQIGTVDKIDIVNESFRVKWYENKRKQTKWINFKEEFEIIPSFWAKIRKSFWSNLLIGFITLVITTITSSFFFAAYHNFKTKCESEDLGWLWDGKIKRCETFLMALVVTTSDSIGGFFVNIYKCFTQQLTIYEIMLLVIIVIPLLWSLVFAYAFFLLKIWGEIISQVKKILKGSLNSQSEHVSRGAKKTE